MVTDGPQASSLTEAQIKAFAARGSLRLPVRIIRKAEGYVLSVEPTEAARKAFNAAAKQAAEHGIGSARAPLLPLAAGPLGWVNKHGEVRVWLDLDLMLRKLDALVPEGDVLLVREAPARPAKPRRKVAGAASEPDED